MEFLGCEVVRCDDSDVSVLQRRGVKGARASKRLQPAKVLGASAQFPILRFRCQVLGPKLQVPSSWLSRQWSEVPVPTPQKGGGGFQTPPFPLVAPFLGPHPSLCPP